MKRTLAPEANYSSEHYDSHHPVGQCQSEEDFKIITKRIQKIIPTPEAAAQLILKLEK